MEDAVLTDNIPYCPKCKIILSRIVDYRMVEYMDERYIQFVRRCSKCNGNIQYCEKDVGEKRFVFNSCKINVIQNTKEEDNI